MLDRLDLSAEAVATGWMAAFAAAMDDRSEVALSGLFAPDSHWRNLFGISWHFATFSERAIVVRELLQRAGEVRATAFRLDPALLAPRKAVVAGREVIEAVIRFDMQQRPRPRRDPPAAVARRHGAGVDHLDHARLRLHHCRAQR